MARVTDDQTQVVGRREIQGSNDIIRARDIDGIADIVSQRARGGLVGEGITAVVCPKFLHHRRRGGVTKRLFVSDIAPDFRKGHDSGRYSLGRGNRPVVLESGTSHGVVVGVVAWGADWNGGNQPSVDSGI